MRDEIASLALPRQCGTWATPIDWASTDGVDGTRDLRLIPIDIFPPLAGVGNWDR